MTDPKLIIADEPTGSLDAAAAANVLDLIERSANVRFAVTPSIAVTGILLSIGGRVAWRPASGPSHSSSPGRRSDQARMTKPAEPGCRIKRRWFMVNAVRVHLYEGYPWQSS